MVHLDLGGPRRAVVTERAGRDVRDDILVDPLREAGGLLGHRLIRVRARVRVR